ncbi:MAG: hypothetical protein AAFR54_00685 [Planctomycetota bacterium]
MSLPVVGCAVATIDVDVYKGPLAYHEDVQVQQMISLATAAKPMLIELRDNLEWGGAAARCREQAIREGWYRAGYVADPRLQRNDDKAGIADEDEARDYDDIWCERVFKKAGARRVNILLSLYDDLGPPKIAQLRSEMTESWRRLDEARRILDREANDDWDLATTILSDLGRSRARLDTDVRDAAERHKGGARVSLEDRRLALLLRVGAFLDRQRAAKAHRHVVITRIAPTVIEDLSELRAAAAGQTLSNVGTFDSGTVPANSVSTNEAYDLLAQRSTRDEILDALDAAASDDERRVSSETRRRFHDRVDEICAAYVDARQATSSLLASTLEMIVEAERNGLPESSVIPLSRLASELIDPPLLVVAAELDGTPSSVRSELASLVAASFTNASMSVPMRYVPSKSRAGAARSQWTYDDFADARRGLARALRADPTGVATTLLLTDPFVSNYRTAPRPTGFRTARTFAQMLPRGEFPYWIDSERRRYGISTLPRFLPTNTQWTSIQDAYSTTLGDVSIAEGLETGRMFVGIDRAVEQYLAAAESRRLDDSAVDAVVDSLIVFSTKVLFLANNADLLDPPRRPGLAQRSFATVWHHSLGGTALEGWVASRVPFMRFAFGGVQQSQRSYTRVLEAVGNTLRIETDEYKKRTDFEHGEKRRADMERSSILATAVDSSYEYIGALLEGIAADNTRLTDEIKELGKEVEAAKKAKTKAESDLNDALKGLNALDDLAKAGAGETSPRGKHASALASIDPKLAAFEGRATAVSTRRKALVAAMGALRRWNVVGGPTAKKEENEKKFVALLADARAARTALGTALDDLSTAASEARSGSEVAKTATAAEDWAKATIKAIGNVALLPTSVRPLQSDLTKAQASAAALTEAVQDADKPIEAWSDYVRVLRNAIGPESAGPLAPLQVDSAGGTSPPKDSTDQAAFRKELRAVEDGISAVTELSLDKRVAAARSVRAVRQASKTIRSELVAMDDAFGKAKSAHATQERNKGSATRAITDASRTIQSLERRVAAKDAQRNELEIAATEARGFRARLRGVQDSSSEEIRASVASMAAEMRKEAAKLSANKDGAKPSEADKKRSADLRLAARVIEARRPSIPVVAAAELEKLGTPRELVDQMLGILQHEHARAVLEGGKDSEEAVRLTDAYKSILARRASLMRLRPASAFLRTSFPSTSLQGDPGLVWTNQLQDKGVRGLPVVSDVIDFLSPNQNSDLEIQAGIDKRFWQNVNRVRVSGTGRSNYVIAKDDIGNWYVKAYEANPQKVLKSARNLGMLAIGDEIGTDLLGRVQARADGKDGSTAPATTSTVGRLATFHRTKYLEESLAVRDELAGTTAGSSWTDELDGVVKGADLGDEASKWRSAVDAAADPHLETAQAALNVKVDLEDENEENDEALPHVLKSLGALLDLGRDLDQALEVRVGALTESASKSETELTAAKAAVEAAKGLLETRTKELADATAERDAAKTAAAKAGASDADRKRLAEAEKKLDEAERGKSSAELEVSKAESAAGKASEPAAKARELLSNAKLARARLAKRTLDLHGRTLDRLRRAADTYQVALDVLTSGAVGTDDSGEAGGS